MTVVVPRARVAKPSDWLVRQLPAGLLGEDFFVRFVELFQAEADTLVAHAQNLPHLADPQVAPLELVRWMAGWIGSPGIDPGYPEDVQRQMLLVASEVLRSRGTVAGLRRLLEVYSGGEVEIEEGGGVFAADGAPDDTSWVVVGVTPRNALLTADAIVQIVLAQIPAHVRAEIWVGDDLVWPKGSSVAGGAPAGAAVAVPDAAAPEPDGPGPTPPGRMTSGMMMPSEVPPGGVTGGTTEGATV